MIQKRKSIIIKLLICLIIIGITMLIKGVISNAAPSLYEVGELDIDGGTGISSYPELYLFGEQFCAYHGMNLIRTEDGGKFSTPIVHYNRNYALYYNETISYQPDETYE